jgi:hypothetical protein
LRDLNVGVNAGQPPKNLPGAPSRGSGTYGFLRRAFARVGGFGFSTLLSGVTSALVIPVLIGSAGPDGWASLAVGQSIGNLGGVVLGFGWAVAGPTAVAGMAPERRRVYLKHSLLIRLIAFSPVGLAAGGIAAAVPTADRTACALAALAACSLGLSAGWYYVGLARPGRFLRLETLPRVAATIGGGALVLMGAPLAAFPVLALVGSVVATTLAARVVHVTPGDHEPLSFARATRVISQQRHAAVTGLLASVYMNLPVIAVSVLAPANLPSYALVDRLFRIANTGLTPYTQTVQSWVPSGVSAGLPARIRVAVRVTTAVAVSAGVAFTLVAPLAGLVLSNFKVIITIWLAAIFAVVLVATTVSQTVGIACLLALGEDRAVARSALVGCIGALLLLLPAAILGGAEGTAGVVATCEAVVVVYQLNALRTALRSRSSE